jgi:hypothetical protein
VQKETSTIAAKFGKLEQRLRTMNLGSDEKFLLGNPKRRLICRVKIASISAGIPLVGLEVERTLLVSKLAAEELQVHDNEEGSSHDRRLNAKLLLRALSDRPIDLEIRDHKTSPCPCRVDPCCDLTRGFRVRIQHICVDGGGCDYSGKLFSTVS